MSHNDETTELILRAVVLCGLVVIGGYVYSRMHKILYKNQINQMNSRADAAIKSMNKLR